MPICHKCGYDNLERAKVCTVCDEALTATDGGPVGAPSLALPTDPKDFIGRVLNGKYKVLSLLGEGGMGVVYKVQHLLLQKKNHFAMKILHPRFSADRDFHRRFLQEVEVTMELTHENIIQIRDFGMTERGLLFFTMDYFPGRSLKSLIEESGSLPTSQIVTIARQVLLALREACKAGVIHRDLKPDNILIDLPADGPERVRVLDFGIAKILEAEDTGLTQGHIVGTPKYMSPEQASGDPVDGRSDLYSLGIICYEMLMGRVPFTTGTLRTILLHQIKDPPPPFSSVRPDRDVPRQLEDLVFAMLEKDPEYRPESAEVVLDALQAEATVRRTQFVRKRERPQKKRLALLALVCLTAGLSLEHFVPWRVFLFPQAEAEGRDSRSQYPGSPGDARVPVVPTAPEAPTNSSAVQPIRKATRLRCEVCGTFYKFGEKNGGMCHGLPLLDSE